MNIRDATEGDLPAIVAIYNAAVVTRRSTADTKPVTVQDRLRWFQDHNPKTRPIWVAEVDGRVAGWLSLQSYSARPAYWITAEVSVYVAPEHQRRGIGRRLLEEAVCRGPSMGLRNLLAIVFAHNKPSLALFRGLGFEQWGRLPRVADLDGVERDVVILGRRVE